MSSKRLTKMRASVREKGEGRERERELSLSTEREREQEREGVFTLSTPSGQDLPPHFCHYLM